MTDILVRDVPNELVDSLKQRAARHGRSLQQELLDILTLTVREDSDRLTALEIADVIRKRLEATGRDFGDSTADIREDRER